MLVKIDIKAVNNQLEKLIERRSDVLFEEIPDVLKKDFSEFMLGQTITKKEEKLYYHYRDFLNWLGK